MRSGRVGCTVVPGSRCAPSGLHGKGCRGLLSLAQQPLRLLAELGAEVCARQRIGEVGGEKADLGAAVEALAIELQSIERLRLGELDHGVGELDLAAGAAALPGEDAE